MDKIFTIYAGVNGAGKTTLYRTKSGQNTSKRLNTDEMVNKLGTWKNPIDQIKASKIILKKRKYYFEKGISFNQETTLTGKSILKAIDKAINYNFKIHMHYVGVSSPEIAVERVKARVLKGGHGIPEQIIRKRYTNSLNNLKKIINKCNEITIYDNTYNLKIIFCNLDKIQIGKIEPWIKDIINEIEKSKQNTKIKPNPWAKKINEKKKDRGFER